MKTSPGIIALLLGASALMAYGADAATNWTDQCAKCHGPEGKGDTKMGKKLSIRDLTDPKVQAEFTDEQGLKAIKEGITDKNGKTTMKAIEGLSEEEMKALIQHVRTLKK